VETQAADGRHRLCSASPSGRNGRRQPPHSNLVFTVSLPEKVPVQSREEPNKPIGEGVFRKCRACASIYSCEQLIRNWEVCPGCGHHHPLSAPRWRELLLDDGRIAPWAEHLETADPLDFFDGLAYRDRVAKAKGSSRCSEAIEIGRASIMGHPIAYGAFVFAFMGGSMGSVVGEKLARLFEQALVERLPVLLLHASGGARMQEGILSLMQMAKICAALARFRQAARPYLSLCLHPTTGGVAASTALLGDVNLAEPGALIGFAGPRVIENTIRQKLPEGFQRAEFLVDHGMMDLVVPRAEMRSTIARLLMHLGGDRS
jgi:acetyl-CoA carboxylase carboxyl transferase subunit beta